MRKLKLTKVLASLLVAASLLTLNPIGASAEWRQDTNGWWYAEGSSWATGWREIGGKWYHFNTEGYMTKNKVIDGYVLGADGAWIQNTDMIPKIVHEQENNNSMGTSNLLTEKNSFVIGTLSGYKDIDSYKFTFDSDKKITVVGAYENDTLGLTKNVMIGIVNKDGKVIGAAKETAVNNKTYKMLTEFQLSAGTYYLIVVGGGENTDLWNNDNKYGVSFRIL